MDTYKLVISYNSKQYSTGNTTDVDTYLLLDTIQERTISGTNTTPSQPMQSGDTISDHTYREPNTYNISGSFSLDGDKVYNLGNQNDYVNDFTKTKMDRLSRIQETFEAIKKGGYLCTLTFMSMPDNTTSLSNAVLSNASTRFKIRKNMQLKSFQWSEKLNTFKYTLNFSEIIFVNQQEYYDLPEEERTYYKLPKINAPSASSLSAVLTDPNNNTLYETIIRQLYDNGYIKKEFLEYCANTGLDSIGEAFKGTALILVAIAAVAIAKGIVTSAVIVTAASAGVAGVAATMGTVTVSMLFPVGAVVAGAIAIVMVVAGINKLIKAGKKAKKVIKLRNGSAIEGLNTLQGIFNNVANALNKIDSKVNIYKFNSDAAQQTVIKINGKTYVIEVSENNMGGDIPWNFKVLDTELRPINTVVNNNPPIITNMNQFNSSGIWFVDSEKIYEVFIVNLSLDLEQNQNNIDAFKNVAGNASTYSIWVSEDDINENINNITQHVLDILTDEGYN